eukprot:CAMPEP_0113465596 /NCGR_PEP_ID=MMETSP0014_2-20120614/13824_1 /TAXON_ID=2857 /ORGANISM="Nitzschia sp." /LENGTH=845 /DNA_ID=CAMNT_0000357765 /DNA_START=11 /DNA_END=2545 /DNA_ORIENTATION=+ /assembly_acc=CAM_ASM_000159
MGKGNNNKRRKRQAAAAATATATTEGTESSAQAPSLSSSRVSASAWKPVNVHLGPNATNRASSNDEDENNNVVDSRFDHEDMEMIDTKNHYDDPKLSRIADRDLHMQPGEDCAMFFGLEVLDSSAYQLVGSGSSKRLLIVNNNNNDDDDDDDKNNIKDETSKKKDRSKKDKKKPKKDDVGEEGAEEEEQVVSSRPTKKQKKEKQKSQEEDFKAADLMMKTTTSSNSTTPTPIASISEEQIQSTTLSWGKSTGGTMLHRRLVESLCRLQFFEPTPIQAATLSASIMGRRNMVGAAPTGSGKTLAFLLPILDKLLNEQEEEQDDENVDDETTTKKTRTKKKSCVKALIMTPTRELATQIHKECEKLVPDQCVTLVGGIALVKQVRLLQTKRPSIIVGTPGRVYQMMSSGEHEHLRDLSNVQFLVLDEADRMTQEHSFPQMIKILDMVNDANPSDDGDEEDSDEESDDEDEDDRMMGLPGVPGEARLAMLSDDILERIESQRQGSDPDRINDEDDEIEERTGNLEIEDLEEDLPKDWLAKPRVHRQTFIFSATLTLPFTSTKAPSLSSKKTKKLGLQGGIVEILEKTHAMGETKVVDLSYSSSTLTGCSRTGHKKQDRGVKLPPGLSVEQIKCTQRHKDSHLYAYLMTTSQGSSGPCLVFCNSIAGVRRVGATLQALGFAVRVLHAHMQQRARFKAVESLKNSESRAVVVCTDVAARGLDIPSVSTVVHYDTARSVDVFVHRSGRTARGMGEGAKGSSLSLVAPAEDKAHGKIAESANVTFSKVMLDGRLLTAAQERTNLASKIIEAAEMENKANSSNRWFAEKAKEADLDLDDGLIEDESQWSEKEQ